MWFDAADRRQKVNRAAETVLVVKCTCEEMENSLLCTESLNVSRGEADPVIFADRRVLDNLLADEARSMVNEDYFTTNQTDLTPNMRSVVVTWMMEVCTLHLIVTSLAAPSRQYNCRGANQTYFLYVVQINIFLVWLGFPLFFLWEDFFYFSGFKILRLIAPGNSFFVWFGGSYKYLSLCCKKAQEFPGCGRFVWKILITKGR